MKNYTAECMRLARYLAEVGVVSLLKAALPGAGTQLDIAEYLGECRVVDGIGKVHTQLVYGSLYTHRLV